MTENERWTNRYATCLFASSNSDLSQNSDPESKAWVQTVCLGCESLKQESGSEEREGGKSNMMVCHG